ncbi:hypothetical protein BKA81DRAFT_95305 [Phyllosticta paracitricarpa]|uniref:Uncharacterized protein n=1 Tax=Phyllosticta citricarpa TaxID=55181 RepID=A0ABR1MCV0_9PEZI
MAFGWFGSAAQAPNHSTSTNQPHPITSNRFTLIFFAHLARLLVYSHSFHAPRHHQLFPARFSTRPPATAVVVVVARRRRSTCDARAVAGGLHPAFTVGRVPAKLTMVRRLNLTKCERCKQALNLGVSEPKMTIALLMSSCLNHPPAHVDPRRKLDWDARRLFDLRLSDRTPQPPCATPVALHHCLSLTSSVTTHPTSAVPLLPFIKTCPLCSHAS